MGAPSHDLADRIQKTNPKKKLIIPAINSWVCGFFGGTQAVAGFYKYRRINTHKNIDTHTEAGSMQELFLG